MADSGGAMGGAASGAAGGTAMMPGIGTAIGAGLGFLGGWLGNKGTEEWNQEYIKRQKDWYKDMLGMSRTNAAGQMGEQAGAGAQRALDSLTQSTEATQAGLRANQMGGRMLSAPQASMDASSAAAKRVLGAQKSSTMNLARESGLGGAGIADLARSLAEQSSQTLGSVANQVGQQTQSALAGAGELFTKAPQILNQDLQSRFNAYVAPYLTQHAQFKSEVDQIKEDPYQGLEGALGAVGNTMISSDFMEQMRKNNQQGYQNSGLNVSGGNQQDLFGRYMQGNTG